MLRKNAKPKPKLVSESPKPPIATQSNGTWRGGVLLPSMFSGIFLLAAFPPLNWFPLAWIAPIGWLIICQRATPVGRKGYWALWLSGCLFWLVSLHSIRLAFFALYVGWFALSFYLASYVPVFVGVTRLLVHRWKVPLPLAAPISWTAIELLRSMLLTGYAANTLAHSQALQPTVIQIVDQLGTGGLSFLMMMFAACVLSSGVQIQGQNKKCAWAPALAGAMLIVSVLGYGRWRLQEADQIAKTNPLLRVLLLQENTPSVFEVNPNWQEHMARSQEAWTRYATLCRNTVRASGAVDLVVWPESTFTSTSPLIIWELENEKWPQELEQELDGHDLDMAQVEQQIAGQRSFFETKVRVASLAARGLDPFAVLPESHGPDLLVGSERIRYSPERVQRTNSALWIASDGTLKDHYEKMHLVAFGEFIPLKPILGWLSQLFGFAGVEPGDQPKTFEVHGTKISPNICFESMVPRLIRWQIRELSGQHNSPDVLINLTNDSWFKGTSMLDHHLASSILCSVENHRPMLIAANTGISAEIDGSGRVLQQVERLTAGAIIAQPRRDGRWGLVQSAGYPLSWLCGVIAATAVLATLRRRPESRE